MRKFEFDKAYEEIEIAGDVYRIDMSDDKVKEYQSEFNSFYKEAKEIEDKDTKDMSVEQQNAVFDDMSKLVGGAINKILGDGAYDVLYEKAGGSLINMMDLITELSDIIGDKVNKVYDKQKEQYKRQQKAK